MTPIECRSIVRSIARAEGVSEKKQSDSRYSAVITTFRTKGSTALRFYFPTRPEASRFARKLRALTEDVKYTCTDVVSVR